MTAKEELPNVRQQIREYIVKNHPHLHWFDGEVKHTNYPNLLMYNQALEKYVSELEGKILAVLNGLFEKLEKRLDKVKCEANNKVEKELFVANELHKIVTEIFDALK